MPSLAEENYLKAIYHLSTEDEGNVSTNAISETLNTKPASVSDMLRKLSGKELVSYRKYQGVSLTPSGRKVALQVIRKHRLWEVFLVDKLNFNWDEVHDVAEQLEHIQSPLLIHQLDEFLGHPAYDPHGDPIPDENGGFPEKEQSPLSELTVG
ncbi:MAG: metal-dependent transcriptional regulator, partial [Cyclobacteriaceae bacterium]